MESPLINLVWEITSDFKLSLTPKKVPEKQKVALFSVADPGLPFQLKVARIPSCVVPIA